MVTSRRPIRAMMCDQLSAGLFIRQAAPSHDLQTPNIDDLLHPVRVRVCPPPLCSFLLQLNAGSTSDPPAQPSSDPADRRRHTQVNQIS